MANIIKVRREEDVVRINVMSSNGDWVLASTTMPADGTSKTDPHEFWLGIISAIGDDYGL